MKFFINRNILKRSLIICAVFSVCTVCTGQGNVEIIKDEDHITPQGKIIIYHHTQRHRSRPGDYKSVIVPAINPRQARLDAQTYHLGWDAVDVRPGQSAVMYEVLLRKRPERVPGSPPVTRRIPQTSPSQKFWAR